MQLTLNCITLSRPSSDTNSRQFCNLHNADSGIAVSMHLVAIIVTVVYLPFKRILPSTMRKAL